jgi:hypothetical protein
MADVSEGWECLTATDFLSVEVCTMASFTAIARALQQVQTDLAPCFRNPHDPSMCELRVDYIGPMVAGPRRFRQPLALSVETQALS